MNLSCSYIPFWGTTVFYTFFKDFPTKESPIPENAVLELMFYDHEQASGDDKPTFTTPENEKKEDFLTLYFDRSKTKEGVEIGCVLTDPMKNKTLITCRLEFECTNNLDEYEALIQGKPLISA